MPVVSVSSTYLRTIDDNKSSFLNKIVKLLLLFGCPGKVIVIIIIYLVSMNLGPVWSCCLRTKMPPMSHYAAAAVASRQMTRARNCCSSSTSTTSWWPLLFKLIDLQ